MGLFAPEIVVYVAWRQYKSASLLTTSMNKVFEETHQERKHPWTIVHSFCACMGGFAMDTANSLEGPYTKGSLRLSLGSRGVAFVARHGGRIPDVSKASIFDRSKADNVAKCLVCLQAGWAIVQCISRLASHLPLTLLEINTLGHVLCALLIYFFWLRKPLDVNGPTVLTGEWTHPICAWMLMGNHLGSSSEESGVELSGLYVYPRGSDKVAPANNLSTEPPLSDHGECETGTRQNGRVSDAESVTASVGLQKSVHSPLKDLDPGLIPLREDQVLSGTLFGLKPDFSPNGSRLSLDSQSPVRTANLDVVTATRWRLASIFVSEHWNILRINPAESLPEGPLAPNTVDFADLITLEVPDWPGLDQLPRHTFSTFAKLCAATTLYGGLHIGAWNSVFPTTVESLLWKTSAVLIAGSGLTTGVAAVIKYWITCHNWKVNPRGHTFRYFALALEFSQCTLCSYGILILGPLFVLARLYLVAEAFISLRRLPIEAYQTPAWTQWIPHL